MAQLSNDCFAAGDRPLRLDEAQALVRERLTCVVGTEQVGLGGADGRVLASDIVSPFDLPPFDNSAVDGYAIRFSDLMPGGDTRLPVAARVAAGDRAGAVPPGTATRIFTGAPMPAGCDTVFMQEDARLDGAAVTLPSGLDLGANRRRAGEDLARGAVALRAGRRLRPADLGLLGAIGSEAVAVRRALSVAVFSTGDELAASPRGGDRIFDANLPMLAALLRRAGCRVTEGAILPDRRSETADAIRGAAAEHDLVVTSGGVSMGEEDHVRDALAAGGTLTFWRLGIKPGRPVGLAIIGGTPVIGLPGNPVAAFVTFLFVARPIVAALGGESYDVPPPLLAVSAFRHRKKTGRREFVRVRLRHEDGRIAAHPHPREGAGIITSLTESHGLADLGEEVTALEPGEPVPVWLYSALY